MEYAMSLAGCARYSDQSETSSLECHNRNIWSCINSSGTDEGPIAPRKDRQIARNARLNSAVVPAFISVTRLTLVNEIVSNRIDSYGGLLLTMSSPTCFNLVSHIRVISSSIPKCHLYGTNANLLNGYILNEHASARDEDATRLNEITSLPYLLEQDIVLVRLM